MRFVDPSKEPLGRFLQIRGDLVEPTNGSPAGDYMIDEIRLNAPVHIERRQKRSKLATLLALAEASSQVLRTRNDPQANNGAENAQNLDQIDSSLAELRSMLQRHAPLSDVPTTCLCASGVTAPAPTGPAA
jgi:hypothetical protein